MNRQRLQRVEARLARSDRAPAAAPRAVQTAQDVIDLLEEQVQALRAAPYLDPVERARTLGYLAGLARRAIETGTIAARLEMVEAVLKQRREDESS